MLRFSLRKRGKYFKTVMIVAVCFALVFIVAISAYYAINESRDNDRRMRLLEKTEIAKTTTDFASQLENVASVCGYLATVDFDKSLSFAPNENYAGYLSVAGRVEDYISIFNQIDKIFIKTENDNLFASESGEKTYKELDSQKDVLVAEVNNVNIYALDGKDAYNILVFQQLHKNGRGHTNNDVTVCANSIAIGKETLMRTELRKEYVVTKEGNVVSAYDLNSIGKNISAVLNLKDFSAVEQQTDVNYNGRGLLTVQKMDGIELYVVSVVGKDYYKNYLSDSSIDAILICVLFAIIILVTYVFVLRFSYAPILKILKQISYYQDIEIGSNINEIEYINSKFKQLYEDSEKTAQLYKELKAWNMAALQAQICPHFLYNTLDAINWLAFNHFKDENDISKIATKTAHIMRSSLDISRLFSDIKEELEVTHKYADIIDIRYEGRYDVSWHIDEEALEYIIPRLTIQAMLENAVTHAFSRSSSENKISVKIECDKDDIYIHVEDNGDGISKTKLEEIRKNIDSPEAISSKNVGLRNIHQRCKLVFGEGYGITIKSELGKGSTFILKIHKEKLN